MKKEPANGMDLQEAQRQVGNIMHLVLIGMIESWEHAGLITGNGHHFVQQIIGYTQELLANRWRGGRSSI